MFFIKHKKTRKQQEEEIRSFMDFSNWNREDIIDELNILIPEIDLSVFSDEELESLLRANYDFEDYTDKELRSILKRHERYINLSREDLEESLEEADNEKFDKTIEFAKYAIIAMVIIVIIISYFGMQKYDSRLQTLEYQNRELYQENLYLSEENDKNKEDISTLSNIIDAILWYIISDDVESESSVTL